MADIHNLGIDTADHLNELGLAHNTDGTPATNTWPAVRGWRPSPIVFAGRYFLPITAAIGGTIGHSWQRCETKGIKTGTAQTPALNPDLAYVVPLQGPGDDKQFNRLRGKDENGKQQKAATVQGWGAADAKAICDNIKKILNSGELDRPSSVIIYLDVEDSVTLSADYWYGWASKVWWYPHGISFPFYPGLYCTTVLNPDAKNPIDGVHHRIPSQQKALTGGPNNLASRCYGVWASNPEVPSDPSNQRFTKGFAPDWGAKPNERFDVWVQKVHVIFGHIEWKTAVPVRIWQYVGTEKNPHPTFDHLQVDFNETADGDAVNWMLIVPAKPPAFCK